MTDDDLPSGAEILAMRTARELFGVHLGDARALRRAWARVARAYRDSNPRVFQHARELFERARDGDDTAVPGLPGPGSTTRSVDVSSDSARRWLDVRDYASLASMLEHDPGAIVQDASMQEVLLAVVVGLGPDLTSAQMKAVERELSHEGLVVSPGEEIEIRLAMAQTRVVCHLRNDANVPDDFTDAVDAARSSQTAKMAQSVGALVTALNPSALRSCVDHVERNHCGALSILRRELMRFEASSGISASQMAQLHALYSNTTEVPMPLVLLGGALFSGVVTYLVSLLLVAAFVGLDQALSEDLHPGPIAAAMLVLMLACTVVYGIHQARKDRFHAARRSRFVAVIRRMGVLPSEAVRAIVWQTPSGKAENQTVKWTETLVALDSDPHTLFECWGDALNTRLAAQQSEASS